MSGLQRPGMSKARLGLEFTPDRHWLESSREPGKAGLSFQAPLGRLLLTETQQKDTSVPDVARGRCDRWVSDETWGHHPELPSSFAPLRGKVDPAGVCCVHPQELGKGLFPGKEAEEHPVACAISHQES